jgi:DGQHR domain-containing protein
MSPIKRIKVKSLQTKFGSVIVYTQPMKIKDVLTIFYVAVRNKDQEQGAVQRVLNRQRISSIKKYLLDGNTFFSTFILNWTDSKVIPEFKAGDITIPIVPAAAQVIDGQHRLYGLREAYKENESMGDQEILVSLSINLTTKEAAQIFVNINSEQKPVPKSLIYDLFGEIDSNPTHTINRATDIAEDLNTNIESPYYSLIKYPGTPRGAGIIDLSTVVNSLKNHLDSDGVFPAHNLTNFQNQKLVILNFFKALKSFYDKDDLWYNKNKNPFITNGGFNGAIEHLVKNLIIKCAEIKSFTSADFEKLLDLPAGGLLLKNDLKNLGGRAQSKIIREFLESNFLKSLPDQDEYQF